MSNINIAQWTQTNGPEGGTIQHIEVSGSDIFTVANYKIFLSNDIGSSWIPLTNNFTHKYVNAIAISGNYIYAGMRHYDAIYLSTDRGISWSPTNISSINVKSIMITDQYVMAGTEYGLYKSSNNGLNWNSSNNGLTNYNVNVLKSSGDKILAGTLGGGIFISNDNGLNWSAINNGLSNLDVRSIDFNNNNIFIGTFGGGIFHSIDNGENWTAVNNNLLNLNIISLVVIGDKIFAGTSGSGIFFSSNNGASWIPVNNGLNDLNINTLAVIENKILAGCIWGGIKISTNNGADWSSANSGLKNLFIYTLAVSGNDLFTGTWGAGIFKSSDNGISWFPVNTGLTKFDILSLAVSGSYIIAGSYNGGIFVSSNSGINWIQTISGFNADDIRTIEVSNGNIYAGSTQGVLLSTNNGLNWSNIGLWSIMSIGVNGSDIYTCAWDAHNGWVYLSTNNGVTWIDAHGNLPVWHNRISSFAFSGNKIFAGSYYNVYVSTNNGSYWSSTGVGLSGYSVTSLITHNNYIIAGTSNGVFLKSIDGLNWIKKNQGFPNDSILIFSLLTHGNHIYAGTWGSSVWKRSIAEIVHVKNISSTIPSSFSLSQNYPNPFNPTTNIRFQIPESGFVTLKVFDITGREVATLVNELMNAGEYNYQFSTDEYQLGSGVYFYRLTANDKNGKMNFSETKKMVVVR